MKSNSETIIVSYFVILNTSLEKNFIEVDSPMVSMPNRDVSHFPNQETLC